MKKLMSLALCLILLLCCCACGTAAPVPAPTAEPAAPAEAEASPEPEAAPAESEPSAQPEAVAEAPGESFSPEFTFSTEDRCGDAWDESVFSQYALTMINFWEPWCGPCVGEMPELERLQEEYADRGLLVLGVYSTPGMESEVDKVLKETGVLYPILHYDTAFDAFQSGFVPTTVFVDRNGHVLQREVSEEERSVYADVIRQLGEEQFSRLYIGSASYDDWASIVEGCLG